MEKKYMFIFLVICTSSCLARQCNDCCKDDNAGNCCSYSCCSSCDTCPTSTCRSRCRTSCQVPTTTAPVIPEVEPQKIIIAQDESPSRNKNTNNNINNTNLANSTVIINLNNSISNVNTIHVPINIDSVNTNTIHVTKSDSGRVYDTPRVVTNFPPPVPTFVNPPKPATPRYFFYVIRQPVLQRSGCCGAQPTGCCNMQPPCNFQRCYGQCSGYCRI